MIKIDNSLLQEIGLGSLPAHEKDSLLKHIYETLEMRVGMRLADQMTNQQLDEFERYFEAKDDAGAFKWLETNFPNYKDVVQEEFDKLKAEVRQTAPQILAAATQAAQSGQPQPAQPPVAPVAAGPYPPPPAAPTTPQQPAATGAFGPATPPASAWAPPVAPGSQWGPPNPGTPAGGSPAVPPAQPYDIPGQMPPLPPVPTHPAADQSSVPPSGQPPTTDDDQLPTNSGNS